MKILIIEDEQMIANRLIRLTKKHFGTSLIEINHCDSLAGGLRYIDNNTIDLLLLDLNLNGEDGFDILKNVVSMSFHTIIVSAYKDKAIEAFEYGVLDFVPKPFNENRLGQALQRVTSTPSANSEKKSIKFLSITKRSTQLLVSIEDINYIQGARVYTEIFLKDGKTELHNKSLENLLQLLPAEYERIHKSYIVNIHQIKSLKVEAGGKYTAILKSGNFLPVGRSKYKDLKERYLI